MTDKVGDAGVMTRSRRQRSQSREVGTNGNPASSSAVAKVSTRASHLESVAEGLSTPSNSQKSTRTDSSASLGLNGSSQGSGAGSRATSPVNLSRAQEKDELRNLNDRFAKILNNLSDSEDENKILKMRLTTVQQETSADLSDQIGKYREELDRARAALDAITLEKDQELLSKDKAYAELADLQSQLAKAQKRIDDYESRCKNAEKLTRDRETKLMEATAAVTDSDAALKRIQKELSEKSKQLDQAKNIVEQEVIARTKLENALKTADEKAKFETNLLESKLQRQSLSVTTVDHSTPRSSSRRSGSDFSASVEEMRNTIEDVREELQESMDRMYASKIDGLETLVKSQKQIVDGLNQAVAGSRKDYNDIVKDSNQLRKKTADLEKELQQLYQKFDQHKMECTARIGNLSEQANKTNQQYQDLLEEYRITCDNNVEMRTELEMYNKLLSGEELRLGITSRDQYGTVRNDAKKRKYVETFYASPSGSKSVASRGGSLFTPTNKSQVTRTTVKTSENKSKASGPVRILEVVPGKVVRLENTSEPIVPIGQWNIVQRGVSGETVYQFKKDQIISGNSIISVYSSTEDHPHDGITELMGDSSWIVDDSHLETMLLDNEGKEMASYQVSADSNMAVGDESIRDSPRSGLKSLRGFLGF